VPDAEASQTPTSVLDASAVMALLHDEEGSSAVVDAIADGATISAVNWAEVLSNVAADGDDPQEVSNRLSVTGEEVVMWVEALTAADCMEVARLRPVTKAQGLSLADRACLALAERLGVPALTTDREWAKVDVEAEVRLIR
jgi:PIN domain nuclease of toxin-antitoxin system